MELRVFFMEIPTWENLGKPQTSNTGAETRAEKASMETQESGTGRVRFITRAFPRAFPPQWKAGLMLFCTYIDILCNNSDFM